MKNFNDLSEREDLALAIFLEEKNERVHADFAEGLKVTRESSRKPEWLPLGK